MGGGRPRTVPWTVRALFALVAIQLLASAAVLIGRQSPAGSASASLVGAGPGPTPPTTATVVDETTLPTPDPTASPSTRAALRPAPTAPRPPAEPMAKLAAALNGALGPVRSCLIVQDGG